jgi:hypothetical protein
MFFASAYSPNPIKCWTDLLLRVLPNGLGAFCYRVGVCWRLAGSYKGTSGYGPRLMQARGLAWLSSERKAEGPEEAGCKVEEGRDAGAVSSFAR